MSERLLFVILARSGGGLLPGGDGSLVSGMPLVARAIARTIQAADRLTGGPHLVACATDDEHIACVAREWGVEVVDSGRCGPAGRGSAAGRAARLTLERLATEGRQVGALVLVQSWAALTTVGDLVEAVVRWREERGVVLVRVGPESDPADRSAPMEVGRTAAVAKTGADDFESRVVIPFDAAVCVLAPEELQARDVVDSPSYSISFRAHSHAAVRVDTLGDLFAAGAIAAAERPSPIRVGDHLVGPGNPSFLIAEAGVNHNGSLDRALELVDVAFASGANAVKFQSFIPELVVGPSADMAEYQKTNTGRADSMLDMVRELALGIREHRVIAEHCRRRGIMFLSTPFDEASADLLAELGVPAFKISSGDLTHHSLLKHVARKGRPLLVSTGMSTLAEVHQAVRAIRIAGGPDVALFHCVSNYPAAPSDCNLSAISTLRAAFRVPVGWSDHTLGVEVSVAAVAQGAALIEKHLTLDKSLPGPDHRASLDPSEFRELVRAIRSVESAMGDGIKVPQASEAGTATVARRSVHAAVDLEAGHVLRAGDLRVLRPSTGIPPQFVESLPGRRLRVSVREGNPILWADLES